MMHATFLAITLLLILGLSAYGFTTNSKFVSFPKGLKKPKTGVRSLTAVLDVLAGLAISSQNPVISRSFMPSTALVAVAETKQGLYKEYTVDKVDDSALDEVRRSYKTAEETDEGKNKYWAILAVLIAGSFIIPMVQYYWYVAEED